MKKVWSKWILMVSASLVICLSTVQQTQAQANVSFQMFYDELSPYGSWINDARYGYVWSPNVDPGFTPYSSNGYWVNTSYGNTWVSDYSWGWAPFHYGRWFYDDFYGWLWVPDTTWAPAWVAWRSGGGYYGWAPLMPGFGISVSVGYYNRIPHNYWSFVPYRYVMYRNVYRHCVPGRQVVNVYNNTTIVNNYYGDGRDGRNGRDRGYFTGPSRSEIEHKNHERVPVYDVNDRTRPGRSEVGRSSVSMYRPAVDNSTNSRSSAMPGRVLNEDRVRSSMSPSRSQATMPRDIREGESRDSRIGSTDSRTGSFDKDNVIRRDSRSSTLERNTPAQREEMNPRGNEMRNREAVERVQRERIDNMQRQQNTERMQRDQNFQRQQNVERVEQQSRQQQMRTIERTERSNTQMQRQPQPQMNRSQNQSQMRQQSQRSNVERPSTIQRAPSEKRSAERRRP